MILYSNGHREALQIINPGFDTKSKTIIQNIDYFPIGFTTSLSTYGDIYLSYIGLKQRKGFLIYSFEKGDQMSSRKKFVQTLICVDSITRTKQFLIIFCNQNNQNELQILNLYDYQPIYRMRFEFQIQSMKQFTREVKQQLERSTPYEFMGRGSKGQFFYILLLKSKIINYYYAQTKVYHNQNVLSFFQVDSDFIPNTSIALEKPVLFFVSTRDIMFDTFCGQGQYFNKGYGRCISCPNLMQREGFWSDRCDSNCQIVNKKSLLVCQNLCQLDQWGVGCNNCINYRELLGQNFTTGRQDLYNPKSCSYDCQSDFNDKECLTQAQKNSLQEAQNPLCQEFSNTSCEICTSNKQCVYQTDYQCLSKEMVKYPSKTQICQPYICPTLDINNVFEKMFNIPDNVDCQWSVKVQQDVGLIKLNYNPDLQSSILMQFVAIQPKIQNKVLPLYFQQQKIEIDAQLYYKTRIKYSKRSKSILFNQIQISQVEKVVEQNDEQIESSDKEFEIYAGIGIAIVALIICLTLVYLIKRFRKSKKVQPISSNQSTPQTNNVPDEPLSSSPRRLRNPFQRQTHGYPRRVQSLF